MPCLPAGEPGVEGGPIPKTPHHCPACLQVSQVLEEVGAATARDGVSEDFPAPPPAPVRFAAAVQVGQGWAGAGGCAMLACAGRDQARPGQARGEARSGWGGSGIPGRTPLVD